MRVVILVNPVSGRGTAERASDRACRVLESAGIEVVSAMTSKDPSLATVPELEGAAALVVAGGDGALRAGARAAIRSETPLWHLPCGTANLFARAFGMSRDPDDLLAALRAGRVRQVDVGEANGELFVLMVSVGYDAEIVHDLANRRGGAISRFSYLGPMARQLLRWQPPPLSVTVDGETIVSGDHGMIVAANCPLYMWGLNPAAEALMDDALLDVVILPVRSRRDLLGWLVKCARHRQRRDPRLIVRRGRVVEIAFATPQRHQLDGDPPAGSPATADRLRLEIRAATLPVLCPA